MLKDNSTILYNAARSVVNPKNISEQICSGGVGAAVITKKGSIYTGVCIDTDCSLGMCAERNAISTMITNGEFEIEMVAAVDKRGECTAALRCVQRIYDAAQKFIRYKSSC